MASIDPRDDEELAETRQAQEAHGGSMAPDLVDPTGHVKTGADPDGEAPDASRQD